MAKRFSIACGVLLVAGLMPCSLAASQEKPQRVLPRVKLAPRAVGRGSVEARTVRDQLGDFVQIKRILAARIPASVTEAIGALNDEAFGVREDASARLRANPVPDEVLLAVLERETLTSEQRHRLLKVVRWRIGRRPRGAVGIRMSAGREGVLITELLPDLPAEKVLKVGDQIIRINDVTVRENRDLVEVVQRLMPGTAIYMRVLRPAAEGEEYEAIDVEFPLGSYKKLGNDPDALGSLNPETDRRRRFIRAIDARYGAKPEVVSTSIGTETGVVKE